LLLTILVSDDDDVLVEVVVFVTEGIAEHGVTLRLKVNLADTPVSGMLPVTVRL
jgi:hypothetical protein